MKAVTVKFVWGSSDQIKGEWHLGLWGWYDRLPGLRRSGLAISGRGLLRWAAVLAVVVYVAGAATLYAAFRRNPYNQVTFADTLLLPVRWQHVRQIRGRMLITEGLANLKERRWAEASMKLRTGLAKAPHDWRARLALGQFYMLANQRTNALKVMTEDLGYGYPGRSYLETLFAMANEGEDFDVVISTCERFQGETTDRAWLKLQKNLALLRAKRAAEVLKSVGSGPLVESERETKVTALLELGRPTEALTELAAWESSAKAARPLVLKLEIRALRDAHRLPEMGNAIAEYRALVPSDPRALAYVILQRAQAGQEAEAAATLQDYFRWFSGTEQNLVLIAQTAGEAKSAPLVRSCVEEAAAHGFAARVLKVTLVQAQTSAGDWAGATRTLAELKKLPGQPEPTERLFTDWMTRLLAVALRPDEAPQAGLLEMFQERPISMRVYRETCEVLIQARRFAVASEVLKFAERTFPESRTVARLREQVDEALKPAVVATVPVAAPAVVAKSEKEFFKETEKALQEQRWSDAARSIREVRLAKPRWLETREPDVLEMEIRAAAKLGDALELLGAARLLLDGSTPRASRLVTLARELAAAGDQAMGERLIQEVLRRNQGFPPALRLKAEWHPPAAATKPTAPPAAKADTKPSMKTEAGAEPAN